MDARIKKIAMAAETFSVRPAQAGDMAAIKRLIGLFPDILVQMDLPRPSSFFVAVAGEALIGCAALQICSRRLAELRSLAVDPNAKNRGVGRQLVEACQRRARDRGVRQVIAVTSEVTFFEKAGFSTFREEKTALFYDVGQD